MSILPCMKCKHSLGSNAPNLFCEKFHVVVDHRGGCGVGEPIVMTNADRIRNMTDAELAEWFGMSERMCPDGFSETIDCDACPEVCTGHWLLWLKEEVKE